MRIKTVANIKRQATTAFSIVIASSLFTTSFLVCSPGQAASSNGVSFATADELYRAAILAKRSDDDAEAERFLNTAIELTLAECVRKNRAANVGNTQSSPVLFGSDVKDPGANLNLNHLKRIKSAADERQSVKLSPKAARNLAKYEILLDEVLHDLDRPGLIRDHYKQDWAQQLLSPENNDPATRAELLFYRGLSHVSQKSTDEGERDLNVALAMATANRDATWLLPKIYHSLALNKIRSSKEYKTIEGILKKGLAEADSARGTDPQEKAALLRALAWTHARLGQYLDAEKEAQQALQILSTCPSNNNTHLSSFKLYNILAYIEYLEKEPNASLELLDKAQAEADFCLSPERVADYNKLLRGLNYAALGNNEKARELLGSLAAFSDPSSQRREIIDARYLMGNFALSKYAQSDQRFDCIFYEEMNSLPTRYAERPGANDLLPADWFDKALKLQIELDPDDDERVLTYRYAYERALADQMDFTGTQSAAWNAMKLAEKLKQTNTVDYARALSDHAWSSLMSGNASGEDALKSRVHDMEGAYELMKHCDRSRDESAAGYQSIQQQTLERLAQMYYLVGRLDEAKRCMLEASALGTANWTQPHQYFVYDFLAGLSRGLGDPKSAIDAAQKQLAYCKTAYQRAEIRAWLSTEATNCGDSTSALLFADNGLKDLQDPTAQKDDSNKYLAAILYMRRGEANVLQGKKTEGLRDMQSAADCMKLRFNPEKREETCLQQQFGLFYELEQTIASLRENTTPKIYISLERGRYWWPTGHRVLAFHLDGQANANNLYNQDVQRALDKWTSATQNCITFKPASNDAGANLEIKILSTALGSASGVFHPLKYEVIRYQGDAMRYLQRGEITISDPRILSLFPSLDLLNTSLDLHALQRLQPCRQDQNALESVAMHEVGHALGLVHSPYPEDLMYWSSKSVRSLTANDENTICEYYNLKKYKTARSAVTLASNKRRGLKGH